MLHKFNTLTFWIEIVVAIVVWILAFVAVRSYWKPQNYEIKSDYLRVPTNNAMVVLGLLIPILVALASYFYTKEPEATYSSLLAAIVVLFIVLIVAIWETHSILQVATNTDNVTLKIPGDRSLLVGLAVIYSFLVLGLVYFSIFFLFELSPLKNSNPATNVSKPLFNLVKPRVHINESRDEILQSWGAPTNSDAGKTKLEYQSDQSTVQLLFDEQGKLKEIIETRSSQ
jgi:heme/copper-type cytochrome/quinol oxidase subunit 2